MPGAVTQPATNNYHHLVTSYLDTSCIQLDATLKTQEDTAHLCYPLSYPLAQQGPDSCLRVSDDALIYGSLDHYVFNQKLLSLDKSLMPSNEKLRESSLCKPTCYVLL